MNKFIKLTNEQDYLDFSSKTNGLHDGYIISADYKHPVIVEDGRYVITLPDLTLRILVTSMIGRPVVEIHFGGVLDMRISGGYNDIFGFTMKWGRFTMKWGATNNQLRTWGIPNNQLCETYVQWCTAFEFDWENHSMETDSHTTYVIACDAEWRFTEDYHGTEI